MEKQFECIKIKDGMYLANKVVAYDLQFLVINKFAFVINCASEVPNLFEPQGIKYQKFKIPHDKSSLIFDQQYKRLKKMNKIIQEAQQNGMCCLVHCGAGRYRSLVLVTAYLMNRFKWRLRKAIDFLQSKSVPITLTQSNVKELINLEQYLVKQAPLSLNWNGPFLDQQQELIAKTYNNTTNFKNQENPLKSIPIQKIKNVMIQEIRKQKSSKRVQWQDKIEKQLKKQRKKLAAEKTKQQKLSNQRSRQKIDDIKKDLKTHNMIIPKQKIQINKKKHDLPLDNQLKKKLQQAQILNLIKSSGKLRKQFTLQKKAKIQIEDKESEIQQQIKLQKNVSQKRAQEDGKVYKLTINNYINPNINIIKPPLDKKKKGKTTNNLKKQKDKFNRTYSDKQAFKRPTFYDEKQLTKDATDKQKRYAGSTLLRNRKQRKSQKDKEFKL